MNDELMAQFKAEFKAELTQLEANHTPVMLVLSMTEAWILLSQLQLALRHPLNTGPSSIMIERVARTLQDTLAVTPGLAAVAEMGWNPEYDYIDEEVENG